MTERGSEMEKIFRVGDCVRIVGKNCAMKGKRGQIERKTDNKTWPYVVKPNGPYDCGEYAADELELA